MTSNKNHRKQFFWVQLRTPAFKMGKKQHQNPCSQLLLALRPAQSSFLQALPSLLPCLQVAHLLASAHTCPNASPCPPQTQRTATNYTPGTIHKNLERVNNNWWDNAIILWDWKTKVLCFFFSFKEKKKNKKRKKIKEKGKERRNRGDKSYPGHSVV